MEVSNIETTQGTSNTNEKDIKDNLINIPLETNVLSNLQLQDTFCANILAQIEKEISSKDKHIKYKINY